MSFRKSQKDEGQCGGSFSAHKRFQVNVIVYLVNDGGFVYFRGEQVSHHAALCQTVGGKDACRPCVSFNTSPRREGNFLSDLSGGENRCQAVVK